MTSTLAIFYNTSKRLYGREEIIFLHRSSIVNSCGQAPDLKPGLSRQYEKFYDVIILTGNDIKSLASMPVTGFAGGICDVPARFAKYYPGLTPYNKSISSGLFRLLLSGIQ